MRKEALVKILVSLMQNPSSCPSFKNLTKDDFESLYEIAQLNKAVTFLFHFLDCKRCQKKLTSGSIKKLTQIHLASLARLMIQKREKKLLGEVFNKKGLKVLILKDFSFYPNLYSGKNFIASGDIDLLVKKQDLKSIEQIIKNFGYSLKQNLILKDPIDKKTFLYQEKSFYKKGEALVLHLDLHFQIAIPNSGELRPVSKKVIRRLTSDIIKHSKKRRDCLFEPEIEYFLIFLIVHYFSSDLCTCLRNLYDIILLARLYEKEIDWKKFWQITKQDDLERIALFVLFLGNRVFKIQLPKSLKFSIVLKALAVKKSLPSIAIFPPNIKWDKKPPALEKLFREDFFFKAFLTKNIALSRLMRPRIIIFFLSSLPSLFITQLKKISRQQKLS